MAQPTKQTAPEPEVEPEREVSSPTREQQNRNAEAWLAGLVEKSQAGPFAGIYEITPARARALLAKNLANRNLRKGGVGRLREDIQAGRWQLNGESLVVADDGMLNDGQHRLTAIVEANRSVETVLVVGVSRESRFTLDLGDVRRPADVLHFMGHSSTHILASVARLALAWDASGGKSLAPLKWVSRTQTVERANADEQLQDAVRWQSGQQHELRAEHLPPSPVAFCRYLLFKVDQPRADEFFRGLISGVGLPSGSPMLSTRRYLHTVGNRQADQVIAMILRGWVLFAQGREAQPGDIHGRLPFPGIGLKNGK